MSTYLEWFDADRITAAGYAGGETAADGQQVSGPLAVEIEGLDGMGAMIQGSKSELLRFATDIIEATLIADARAKDREMRLAAMASAEAGVEQLKAQARTMILTEEQHAAYVAGSINDYSINVDPTLRAAALTGNGRVGRYTIAELEAMPMDEYLAACREMLGTTEDPE